ncbi:MULTISPECIES: hypothetical protein [unclassified Mesorhizobium]|uniref:hypothetical protein n=1 Tax=unclassified Mesorhizobium TaxID=325217 RepID=UPI000FCA2072|nr:MULTISPECIES: hypothetical protein [unclassified Mesorhizobium]RUW70901.1 hypothetical protein EOA31_19140 [Mesorhizobium sp. M4B.F.Ca.ET.049.02.1.2]TGV25027.1 hypothetical protein EN786_16440 [Mesorhizobium sp. M4B.F.Ca.ET.143.01.1.1]
MDRRGLLFTAIGAAAFATGSSALAQGTIDQPLDLDAFAATVVQPQILDEIFTDVEFVHSWRTKINPRGYEKGDWQQHAATNRREVWQFIQSNSSVGIVSQADAIYSYEKTGLTAYHDNRAPFQAFLKQIGIDPSGQAGVRIAESLRSYSLLNAAAFGQAVSNKAKESFFWPFC